MKFDYYFATQYKQCFVYFGIPATAANNIYTTIDSDTPPPISPSVLHGYGDHMHEINGHVVNVLETDQEDGYIWSYMPQLNHNDVKLFGGYASGDKIKMFGIVKQTTNINDHTTKIGTKRPRREQHSISTSTTNYKCWTTSLTNPSKSFWSESEFYYTPTDPISIELQAVQCHKHFVIYFYSDCTFLITNEHNQKSCHFSTDSVNFNRYVSCAIIGADMFIVSENKMAKVGNFEKLLVNHQNDLHSVSFDIEVIHTDSTLFVVQDALCAVGGHDQFYEDPFSEIYQFIESAQKWDECGSIAVPRFGASVVVFSDKNHRESVFIAGGFKGENRPCSVIEKLSVNITKY